MKTTKESAIEVIAALRESADFLESQITKNDKYVDMSVIIAVVDKSNEEVLTILHGNTKNIMSNFLYLFADKITEEYPSLEPNLITRLIEAISKKE